MLDTELQDVFLGRQPILDRNQQLHAYEFLFRGGSAANGNFASFIDGNQATATVIINAFTELSLASALGPYQGFIKVDEGLLASDLIYALPPHTVALEVLENVAQTPNTIVRCEQLRQAGYVLATHACPESADPAAKPLLRIAEVIKIDVSRVGGERLRQLIPALKPLRKTLLAEKVETDEQMKLCRDLGVDLFHGYYFARPTVIQGKRPQSSETALLRLLGLISQDADTAEIEKIFKQEPVLTINLLRLTNAAGSGIQTRITSLRHAITILGHRQLLRWLQLLLYSGSSSAAPAVNPLLQLAATRGRLMELLAERTPQTKEGHRGIVDQAFMVGILSLLPTLFSAKMDDLLAQLSLAGPVNDALGGRRGILGELLALVEALEHDDLGKASQVLQHMPDIDVAYANGCLTRALTWVNNLARQ